jgi:peptide/nickel transport system ATP-binding protein
VTAGSGRAARNQALNLLAAAGFTDPARVFDLYPHQLSGGMAQRAVLAMSLCGNPILVIADESTKGLDSEARDRFLERIGKCHAKAALLVITHDLEVAAAGERIVVMYAGLVVEEGPAATVLYTPRHPYTIGLLAAHPSRGLTPIPGLPPETCAIPRGCPFHPRCTKRSMACDRDLPPLEGNSMGRIRCWYL